MRASIFINDKKNRSTKATVFIKQTLN